MNQSQYAPILSFIERSGGSCPFRHLSHFNHLLLTKIQMEGRIQTFKEDGILWVRTSSAVYDLSQENDVHLDDSSCKKDSQGTYVRRKISSSNNKTEGKKESKKKSRPPKNKLTPVLKEDQSPLRSEKKQRSALRKIKDQSLVRVEKKQLSAPRKAAASKSMVYQVVLESDKPLMSRDIQELLPGSHIDLIRHQIRLLIREGKIIGTRTRDRYYTTPEREALLSSYSQVRISRIAKRVYVLNVLRDATSGLTVHDIQLKCSELDHEICLETVRYVLDYLDCAGEIARCRQHGNAAFFYALRSNSVASESLRQIEEACLPTKIIRYLQISGTKHQADISAYLFGCRRPTSCLTYTLRRMVQEGALAAQPVGSCIFYSLNQPDLCDQHQVC